MERLKLVYPNGQRREIRSAGSDLGSMASLVYAPLLALTCRRDAVRRAD
jgi:hypothetical protein